MHSQVPDNDLIQRARDAAVFSRSFLRPIFEAAADSNSRIGTDYSPCFVSYMLFSNSSGGRISPFEVVRPTNLPIYIFRFLSTRIAFEFSLFGESWFRASLCLATLLQGAFATPYIQTDGTCQQGDSVLGAP